MPSARQASGGTARASGPSAPTPKASASRGAGSIVHTRVFLPWRAASAPSAAAVVVLPTPPGPTQTRTFLPRASSAMRAGAGLTSTDLDDHGRDVVGPARLVGGVDEQLAGRLDVGRRAHDGLELRVGHRAPQTIAAHEVEIAGLERLDEHARLDLLLAAEAARHDVAVPERRDLHLRHLGPRRDHLLDDRVVAREPLELLAAQPVGAAVARVRDRELRVAHGERDDRRAHAVLGAVLLRGGADLVVRDLDAHAQQVRAERQVGIDGVRPRLARIGVVAAKERLERVDGHDARDLARVVAAHAVRDDEQPRVDEAAEGVLVLLALSPWMREPTGCERQRLGGSG